MVEFYIKFIIMKTMKQFILVTILIALPLFLSGQSNPDIKQILSDSETRKGIMDIIANDSIMSMEMMETMMNNKNCKMMMQGNEKITMMTMENQGTMMKIMKDNPSMVKNMMPGMMEACKRDSNMMAFMRRAMMDDQQMNNMKQKKIGGDTDFKNSDGMNELK